MFDYRLFFAGSTLDSGAERRRRPLLGHEAKRVYRLPTEARAKRTGRP